MNRALGFGFLDFSFMGIVLFPNFVPGFLIVIVAGVVAEVYRALAAIADEYEKVIVCRASGVGCAAVKYFRTIRYDSAKRGNEKLRLRS